MKKNTIITIGISLLATVFFIGAALIKPNSSELDVYLGAIWVLALSLIVTFSLSHTFVKRPKK